MVHGLVLQACGFVSSLIDLYDKMPRFWTLAKNGLDMWHIFSRGKKSVSPNAAHLQQTTSTRIMLSFDMRHILVCLLSFVFAPLFALERCQDATGGGFCPSLNTCCSYKDNDGSKNSGCIPSDLGAYNATCCGDGLTGCGVGYDCGPDNTCIAKEDNLDPLVQKLPRYQLCSAPHLQSIYGFGDNHVKPAYYSSLGNIETLPSQSADNIRQIVFVVHGSGRNADDYFCTMCSASEKQSIFKSSELLVVALRFAAQSDEFFVLHNGGIPMRWDEGSWRYGAESLANVSSFQVLDDMVNFVTSKNLFSNLEYVKIIGHSAGGQFVQRWALMTESWKTAPSTQAIVVNPSSFAPLSQTLPVRGRLPNAHNAAS